MTEAVKFKIISHEIARQMGLPVTSETFHQYIRKVCNYEPEALKIWKDKYEEVDADIALPKHEKDEKMRGRILTKTGILYAFTDLKASRQKDAPPKLDYQGDIGYIYPIMTDKDVGFLHGRKDVTVILSRDELTEIPKHIVLRGGSTNYIRGQKFFVCDSVWIDASEHKTLDGRVTEASPFAQSFDSYSQEVDEVIAYLANLESRNKNTPRSWFNLSTEDREGIDRYKIGRVKMLGKLTLSTIDQIIKLYDEEASPSKRRDDDSYFNVTLDQRLRTFVDMLRTERWKLKIAALTYPIGGSHERVISGMVRYPTTLLTEEQNDERLEFEAVDAATATERTKELRDMGIPEILRVQNKKISEISDNQLALLTMMLRSVSRFVHHTSYRSWKLPLTPSGAIVAIRNEFSEIDGPKVYKDYGYRMIENALTNAIGITTGNKIYIPN